MRMKRRGNFELVKFNSDTPLNERLEHHSKRVGKCVEFTGCLGGHGYGHFSYQNKLLLAHRAAWIAYVGPIPKGMQVLHHCDNPRCIKPQHLFLGTNADNVADKMRKGREARKAYICSVVGCGAKHSAKGYCKRHYEINRLTLLKE